MENYLPEYLHPLTQHPTLQSLTRLLPPTWAQDWTWTWPPTSLPFLSLSPFPTLSVLRTDYLTPYLVDPLAALLSSSTPDLISVLLLLLILFVSLKILDYARRVVMFWVRVVVRVLFWGIVLGSAAYVYAVGWEKAARDLGWLVGAVSGFGGDLLMGPQGQDQSQSGSGSGERGWGRGQMPAQKGYGNVYGYGYGGGRGRR